MPRNKSIAREETITMQEVDDLCNEDHDNEAMVRFSDDTTHCEHAIKYHRKGLRPQLWQCWECRTSLCCECRRENGTNVRFMVSKFRSFKLKGFDNPAMSLCEGCVEYFSFKEERYPNVVIIPPRNPDDPPAENAPTIATSMRNRATKEERRAVKMARTWSKAQ